MSGNIHLKHLEPIAEKHWPLHIQRCSASRPIRFSLSCFMTLTLSLVPHCSSKLTSIVLGPASWAWTAERDLQAFSWLYLHVLGIGFRCAGAAPGAAPGALAVWFPAFSQGERPGPCLSSSCQASSNVENLISLPLGRVLDGTNLFNCFFISLFELTHGIFALF